MQCYVRIKNVSSGQYLHVQLLDNNKYLIDGNESGSIFVLIPVHTKDKIYFSLLNSEQNTNTQFLNIVLHNTLLNVTTEKTNDSLFCLSGTINETYIYSCSDMLNMFGEKGRYLYESDDGMIHTDGDQSINASLWSFDLLNHVKKWKMQRQFDR
jgi:hypothetical protein